MFRLKSVGVLSLAKISALLHAGISLLIIPFFLLFAVIMTVAPKQPNQPPAVFFVFFALFAPFLYGAIGFVMGAFAGFVYNLVAGWIGGIELHLESMVPPLAPSSTPVNPLPQP